MNQGPGLRVQCPFCKRRKGNRCVTVHTRGSAVWGWAGGEITRIHTIRLRAARSKKPISIKDHDALVAECERREARYESSRRKS